MARSDPLKRVRSLCLALPEATEKEAWRSPTFRVRKKMFAMYIEDDGEGGVALWLNAATGDQDVLVEEDPECFFVPPYMGPRGWVGVRLGARSLDWDDVAELVEDAYRVVAPKRLLAQLDAE